MKINTTRFGEVEVSEDLLFNFKIPIIGYNNLRKYMLIEHDEDSCFKWLQSIENSEVAFPITVASYFNIDYVFEIADEYAEKIDLTNSEDLLVMNIVSIPSNNPQGTTINLRAPIIINTQNLNAMQIILADDSLQIRHPLFKSNLQPITK